MDLDSSTQDFPKCFHKTDCEPKPKLQRASELSSVGSLLKWAPQPGLHQEKPGAPSQSPTGATGALPLLSQAHQWGDGLEVSSRDTNQCTRGMLALQAAA